MYFLPVVVAHGHIEFQRDKPFFINAYVKMSIGDNVSFMSTKSFVFFSLCLSFVILFVQQSACFVSDIGDILLVVTRGRKIVRHLHLKTISAIIDTRGNLFSDSTRHFGRFNFWKIETG